MPARGWKQLLAGAPWFRGEGRFPIAAYSEYVPPPLLGPKPYGGTGVNPMLDGDPHGWAVTEYEEAFELQPGLEGLAQRAVGALSHLGQGQVAHGIAKAKLEGNPYWPPALAEAAGKLPHERYVTLLPLALSRTQDDKGRVRWTLFGGSEQGPARAFWQGFASGPGRAADEAPALAFLRGLLRDVYGDPAADLLDAGFRTLPTDGTAGGWDDGPLPRWARQYALGAREPLREVKYLLTFRPFGKLPAAVQKAYLAGDLRLLPFPGSLVFWGAAPYKRLQRQLPLAQQVPLLQCIPRHENPHGLRVPQSGWMHEPHPDHPHAHDHHGPVRNTYKRSHRWERIHRHEDELAVSAQEDRLAHVLFSTGAAELGLYGKPMARNAQVWTHDYRLVLDGPNATAKEIERAAERVAEGGLFGYRFVFPAMRVGRHEVYWHRPLAAYLSAQTGHAALLPHAPLGYLTAYDAAEPDLAHPVELWPRLLRREPHHDAVHLFKHLHAHGHDQRPHQTSRNVRKLLDEAERFGRLLPSFARRMVSAPKNHTLDQWLDTLPGHATEAERGRRLVKKLRQGLHKAKSSKPAKAPPKSLTFARTANREFEVAFWDTIYFLAHGEFRNKNNADCVRDEPTRKALTHHQRDLDRLGDYLIDYHAQLIARHGLTGKALVGDLPFRWQTDFPFGWMGGWHDNQEGRLEERDLIVVIPGRDRKRAIIMCDHYDTAYMADCYEKDQGGTGARVAANGADDNDSATATLLLAAPIFLDLSKAGKLDCDIWLVHLTGEEFPSDCLGARHLSQVLVERDVKMRLPDKKSWHDLSKAKWHGVYDLDMIAHNNPHDQDVFQIAPGTGRDSLWLAYQAHLAAEAWNASAPFWNERPERKGRGRGRRSPDKKTIPDVALHPQLHGEVRLPYDPRSTLYNTDGQIFSDAGVPVVLFMENYDINRSGYHDTHDTMENIDLDYGAAFSAITIEAVARAATEAP
jgi:hypothetical protein